MTPGEQSDPWMAPTQQQVDGVSCPLPFSRAGIQQDMTPGEQSDPWMAPTQQNSFSEAIKRYHGCIVEGTKRLNQAKAEKAHAEQEISTLQASLKHVHDAAFPGLLSTSESMMKQIKEKHPDTAASVFCALFSEAPPPKYLMLSKRGVFGVVALLGSVKSTSLSRVLSEYLGQDTMLASVCNSSQFGLNTPVYQSLESDAKRFEIPLINRFDVICLEAIRYWKFGLVGSQSQRRLIIEDPKLPDGKPIPGFKGYEVNMIHIHSDLGYVEIKSNHGPRSLRETLFYALFGELQVYETFQKFEAALPQINGSDAVTLDGFIITANKTIYLGCRTPQIHFPIILDENESVILKKNGSSKRQSDDSRKEDRGGRVSVALVGEKIEERKKKSMRKD